MPARSKDRSDITPSTDSDSVVQPTTPGSKSRKRPTPKDAESDEDDFKPDISVSDNEDIKPNVSKRSKASTNKATPSPGSTKANSKAGSGSPGKAKAIPYSSDEDWALVEELRPRIGQPNWAAIAQRVGRDTKSCQNRWAILSKKLEGAVKGIGGA